MVPTVQFMKKKKRIAKISLKNGERKSRKKPESENLVKKPESENLVKKLQSTILPGIVDLVLFAYYKLKFHYLKGQCHEKSCSAEALW